MAWYRVFPAVLLLLNTSYSVNGGFSDKVKLKDVESLTLTNGIYTNGRRSAGVPQLKCVGGSAGCHSWNPSTVQCYNRGSDGADIQWECKSEMPIKYKFGAISVSCEGYDYPNDPYVLRGSCGLEYKLEYAGSAYSQHHSYPGKTNYEHDHESKSSFGHLLAMVGIGIIAVGLYYTCISPTAAGTRDDPPPYPGTRGTHPSAPPPPGFRSDFFPTGNQGSGYDDCGAGSRTYTSSRTQGAGSSGGGFWTGAATGGLLGYMLGRNNNNGGTYQRTGFQSPDSTYGSGSSSFFSSPSSSKEETHSSSGFGGTSRR